jgi:transcription termination factor Rho
MTDNFNNPQQPNFDNNLEKKVERKSAHTVARSKSKSMPTEPKVVSIDESLFNENQNQSQKSDIENDLLKVDNSKSYNNKNEVQNVTLTQNERSIYQNNNQQHNKNNQNNNNRDNQSEEFVINTEKVLNIKELRNKSFEDLFKTAQDYEVQNLSRMLKHDIIFYILKQAAMKGEGLFCEGILEISDDNYGFLRYVENNYAHSSYDIYVSQHQIRKLGLRSGDLITGYVKDPKRGEKYFALVRIETINGKAVANIRNKVNFDNLTPLYPTEKLKFDNIPDKKKSISPRVIDLICPIGKGQRALIVAPPRTGKTSLMQDIAHAINLNHPEVYLIVLLIDERPEEVTDMQRSVKGEVISSTFDEPANRHVSLAEIAIERAKRLVEDGRDVVILLDNITRLARAYNNVLPSSGKVLTGGVDANALQKPKRFFGAARNIEHGGSLTIIATALVETGSKMDEVIFEEFKGTGNSEIVLDRRLSDRRLFPAIDVLKSGTRKEEEMVDKDTLSKMWILRRILLQMSGPQSTSAHESLEFLVQKIKDTDNNQDFFAKMNSSSK